MPAGHSKTTGVFRRGLWTPIESGADEICGAAAFTLLLAMFSLSPHRVRGGLDADWSVKGNILLAHIGVFDLRASC
jgi:hypothetical protein